ncbi:hypothetical protein JYQ62_07425 [Nostoc sp. UHCC 0702]|nr:hypothetical protein JYQ62_07425 [Nostoc sp. UHCC 0702]
MRLQRPFITNYPLGEARLSLASPEGLKTRYCFDNGSSYVGETTKALTGDARSSRFANATALLTTENPAFGGCLTELPHELRITNWYKQVWAFIKHNNYA